MRKLNFDLSDTTNTAAVSALVEWQFLAAAIGINFGLEAGGQLAAQGQMTSDKGTFTQSVSSTDV